ncbi:transposase [Halanaerobium hydrogeniformans]|nr:transposase [Halanaerobium hydrogeniformans]
MNRDLNNNYHSVYSLQYHLVVSSGGATIETIKKYIENQNK